MLIFNSDESESIAQWQYYFFDAGVVGNEVVEGFDGDGLMVVVGWVFDEDFAIPKGVVGKNYATGIHTWKEHIVVLLIKAFVGIDESEVERAFDLRYDVDGIAYVEVNKIAVRSRLELLADEVFEFVVDFDSM